MSSPDETEDYLPLPLPTIPEVLCHPRIDQLRHESILLHGHRPREETLVVDKALVRLLINNLFPPQPPPPEEEPLQRCGQCREPIFSPRDHLRCQRPLKGALERGGSPELDQDEDGEDLSQRGAKELERDGWDCLLCGRSYTLECNLKRHTRDAHPNHYRTVFKSQYIRGPYKPRATSAATKRKTESELSVSSVGAVAKKPRVETVTSGSLEMDIDDIAREEVVTTVDTSETTVRERGQLTQVKMDTHRQMRASKERQNRPKAVFVSEDGDPDDPDYKLSPPRRSRKKQRLDERCNCPNCGKEYLVQCSLQRHYQLCAKGQQGQFFCSPCDKIFIDQARLQIHNRRWHIDHLKEFQCDICNKRFTIQRSVDRHKANVHCIPQEPKQL